METAFIWILSIIVLFGFHLVLKYLKAKQRQQENKRMEAYMKSLEIFCEEIGHRIEATRRYRHDLKGYIQTLEVLLGTDNESETIRQYVEEQTRKHSKLTVSEFCSDEFLNTIICVKKEECEQKGISFQVTIADHDYSGMEEMDKVCLIINLLDNAIEATERLHQKEVPEIRIEIEMDGNLMRIYLENALDKNEEFSFKTKKSDKRNHGLGTAIILQVLDKYDGKRNTVVDKEQHLLKDEICLTLKREEAGICGN